jgi:hypothetical protein
MTAGARAFRSGSLSLTRRSNALKAGRTVAKRTSAFTLVELLVSVGVLVLLIFLATQLLNSAATVTILGHKQMDADSQARQVLDRMAIDVAQMVKRSDVDYYLKSAASPPKRNVLQPGNDKIAFYSNVPGYYPSTGAQSPLSLVSYRVNAQHKLERVGRGLVWNAVSTSDIPAVFLPIPVASALPLAEIPTPTPTVTPIPGWPAMADLNAPPTPEPNAEVMGAQVFRFEYSYLLKGQTDPGNGTSYNAILSDVPWETRVSSCCSTTGSSLCCHTAPEGMQDIAAVVVAIGVIDPRSKALLDAIDPTGAKLSRLNGSDGSPPVLVDFSAGMVPGQLLTQWRAALDANTIGLPQPAISGIRVYERYLYLSPPTLLTP